MTHNIAFLVLPADTGAETYRLIPALAHSSMQIKKALGRDTLRRGASNSKEVFPTTLRHMDLPRLGSPSTRSIFFTRSICAFCAARINQPRGHRNLPKTSRSLTFRPHFGAGRPHLKPSKVGLANPMAPRAGRKEAVYGYRILYGPGKKSTSAGRFGFATDVIACHCVSSPSAP